MCENKYRTEKQELISSSCRTSDAKIQRSESTTAEVQLSRKEEKDEQIVFCLTQQSLSAECRPPLAPSDSWWGSLSVHWWHVWYQTSDVPNEDETGLKYLKVIIFLQKKKKDNF